MRYSLDTSAYSHFVRGHVEAAELIDQAAWIGVSAVVLEVSIQALTRRRAAPRISQPSVETSTDEDAP